jgi:hypothetical protein
MRKRLWLAVVVLGLCVSRPAWAQSSNPWGPPVGPIQNQVIDTNAWAATDGNSSAWSSPFQALTNLWPSFGSSAKKPPKPANKKPSRTKPPPRPM